MPFAAVLELSSLNGINGFQLNGVAAYDTSGRRPMSAGDFNGDGFEDILVDASSADPYGLNYAGSVFIVFGKASGFSANLELSALNGSDGFRLDGVSTYDMTGRSVSSAGDINGDGYDDLIIGARYADPNGASSGTSYVVFGTASGMPPVFQLTGLNGTNGFKIDGELSNDRSGSAVSAAGDVNGDGYDDMLVGAYGAGPNGALSGAAYVIFGKASGFGTNFNLSTLDGTNGFQINGEAVLDLASYALAAAGDINGDGFDDVLVSAREADANGTDSGAAYVVFGKASGFTASLELSALDGVNGFQISGAAAYDQTGRSVSSAGDVNGDGYDDLVIGAGLADVPAGVAGAVFVVFGKASGFAPNLDLTTLDGTNGFRINGQNGGDRLGESVASAGDVNGDGYADVAFGAFGQAPNGAYSGAVYVLYGKSTGFAATFDLATLDGTNGFRVNGEAFNDQAYAVARGGDINGDGVDDLIVGALGADPNGPNSGAAYVIFGQATILNFTGGAGDDSHTGGAGSDAIFGGGGKDTLNGAGGADDIDGGDGNDTLNGGNGDDILAGGSGNDVMNGGAGADVFYEASGANKLNGGDGDDIMNGGSGADRLNGEADDDTLDGAGGNDYLDGGTGTNAMSGGTGNDIFIVRSLNDTVFEDVGEGTDTIRSMISYSLNDGDNIEVLELLTGLGLSATGNSSANTLKGNGGGNTLSGLAGNDRLEGGDGADVLVGGLGRDQLYGNLAGGVGDGETDTFRVLSESVGLPTLEIDTVNDYEDGADLLDFSLIDADGNAGNGDTAFSVSTSGLTKVAGQLYAFYTASSDTTTVRLDINGDGKADYQMALKGGDFTADAAGWLL